MTNPLTQKTVVVSGATSGIGAQTALNFARQGAFVIGVGRDQKRCEAARARILQSVPDARVTYLTADLASQKQIKGLSLQIQRTLEDNGFACLDVLVNVAGVYMGKKEFTEDGVETTFAVNHIAPFLLSNLLLPLLSKSSESRVITVGSNSHYNTRFRPEKAKDPAFFFGLWAYKVSKLCNVLFSIEFNRLQHGKFPRALVADPGLVNTEIGLKDTGGLARWVWRSRKKLGVSPEVPAKTILFMANEPSVLSSPDIYWYLCKPKKPSRASMDSQLARRLWIESCNLCGLPLPEEGNVK